ncbi:PadR family transcriptional regulator [Candidatus Woesearchaeota archaeon]|nr:PadR family transcriptional regulator [Candidatus Woesearchaeota archaeon]
MQINSLINFYTLLLLKDRPKHGYEIIKDLREKLERKVSPSQVYPFLTLLSEKGIISAGNTGKRDKKTYRMTKKGKEFAKKMLTMFGNIAYESLFHGITSCAHCGCKVYGRGFKQRFGSKAFSFCCRYCAASFSP